MLTENFFVTEFQFPKEIKIAEKIISEFFNECLMSSLYNEQQESSS